MNHRIHVKYKTIKLLEDNIEENLYDIGNDSDFLGTTPEAWSMKERIDKLDLIEMKKLISEKDNIEENEKTKHKLGEKYLQKTYLIKDCYLKYTKKS